MKRQTFAVAIPRRAVAAWRATDTDMAMLGSAARSRRDSVVLPAPEGEDITSSNPRR